MADSVKPRKSKAVGIFGVIIVLVGAVFLGWRLFGDQLGVSEASAPKLTVSLDSSSPLSSIHISNTSANVMGVWRFGISEADGSPIAASQVSVYGVTFTLNTPNTNHISRALVWADGGSAKNPLAIVPITGDKRLAFKFNRPFSINPGTYTKLFLAFDYAVVDGTVVAEDTPTTVRIDKPADIVTGAKVYLNGTTAATHYLLRTRPYVGISGQTPSGDIVPKPQFEIARFKLTVDNADDLGFAYNNGNSIAFTIDTVKNDSTGASTTFELVDRATGKVLSTATDRVVIGPGISSRTVQMAIPDYLNGTWPLAAGNTRELSLKMDTSDFEDPGDSVRAWIRPINTDIQWGIPYHGVDGENWGNYMHGDIIARGGVYGNTLVKP